jgi:hypothetical protein
MKRRRHFYLSDDLLAIIDTMAEKRGVGLSDIAEGLLREALGSEDNRGRLSDIESHILRLERRVKAFQGDLEILGEVLSFYIFQWLCHTPPLLDSQREGAISDGKVRHRRFLELLRERLTKGDTTLFGLSQTTEGNNSAD